MRGLLLPVSDCSRDVTQGLRFAARTIQAGELQRRRRQPHFEHARRRKNSIVNGQLMFRQPRTDRFRLTILDGKFVLRLGPSLSVQSGSSFGFLASH